MSSGGVVEGAPRRPASSRPAGSSSRPTAPRFARPATAVSLRTARTAVETAVQLVPPPAALTRLARGHSAAASRPAALPFSLEAPLSMPAKTPAGRPASAALHGLDYGPRRALHACRQRPVASWQPRCGSWAATQQQQRTELTAAGLFAPAPMSPPPSSPGADTDGAASPSSPPGGACGSDGGGGSRASSPGVGSPSPSSPTAPRSLACRRRAPRRRSGRKAVEARRRWGIVRANLTRIVSDERRRLGLAAPTGSSSHASRMWGAAMKGWKQRSAELAVRSLKALHPLSEAEIHALMKHVSLTTLPRYAQLYRKGLPMPSFFVVLRGSLRLSGLKDLAASSTRSNLLSVGAQCAGGAWLEDTLHPDTATAIEPCVMLTIRAAEVRADEKLAPLVNRLAATIGDAWKEELLRHYVPFFTDLPRRSLRQLAPLFSTILVEPKEVLIQEGDIGECVYVLVQGEVVVYRQAPNGGSIELQRITDQSEFTYFGELALYHRKPRSASVRAEDRCFLLVLQQAAFDTFTSLVPDFVQRVKALKAMSDAKLAAFGHGGEPREEGEPRDEDAVGPLAGGGGGGGALANSNALLPFAPREPTSWLAADGHAMPPLAGSVAATGASSNAPYSPHAPSTPGAVEPLGAWVEGLRRSAPAPCTQPVISSSIHSFASRAEPSAAAAAGGAFAPSRGTLGSVGGAKLYAAKDERFISVSCAGSGFTGMRVARSDDPSGGWPGPDFGRLWAEQPKSRREGRGAT